MGRWFGKVAPGHCSGCMKQHPGGDLASVHYQGVMCNLGGLEETKGSAIHSEDMCNVGGLGEGGLYEGIMCNLGGLEERGGRAVHVISIHYEDATCGILIRLGEGGPYIMKASCNVRGLEGERKKVIVAVASCTLCWSPWRGNIEGHYWKRTWGNCTEQDDSPSEALEAVKLIQCLINSVASVFWE